MDADETEPCTGKVSAESYLDQPDPLANSQSQMPSTSKHVGRKGATSGHFDLINGQRYYDN